MPSPVPLPGTPFLILDGDSAHAVAARERGTIVTEDELLAVPEVLAACVPGAVVFDVGAYVGDTARWFLDRGCEVHAFEPFTDTFACLAHNCPEARCVNAAVGDGRPVALNDACDTEWHSHQADNYGTRGVRPALGWNPSLRLDDYARTAGVTRLDLLKLDVEGFEPAAVAGAVELLKWFRPVVLLEVFDTMLARFGWSRWDVLRRLPEGYAHKVVVGSDADDRRDYLCWPAERDLTPAPTAAETIPEDAPALP